MVPFVFQQQRIMLLFLMLLPAWPLQHQGRPMRPSLRPLQSSSSSSSSSSTSSASLVDALERAFSAASFESLRGGGGGGGKGAVVAPPTGEVAIVPSPTRDTTWKLGGIAFSLLPLAPGARRKTIQTEVVSGTVWTHDQIQGVVNVNVPVRQTVIKLRDGGLWVHNPVAPTFEHRRMIKELEAEHGPVKHIVLGTVGLEHKALAGPFAKAFPDAQVWLQPGQWAFPVPLPNALYGFNPFKTRYLPTPTGDVAADAAAKAAVVPWESEIGFEVLGPLRFKSVGTFGETAFVHRSTGTLLVTDTVVRVCDEPPAIIQEDPRALLFHARDDATEFVRDTAAARRKGWRRIVQFGLIFFPSQIQVTGVVEAVRDAIFRVPDAMRPLSQGAVPFSLYPWSWKKENEAVPQVDEKASPSEKKGEEEKSPLSSPSSSFAAKKMRMVRDIALLGEKVSAGADADMENFRALQRCGGNGAGIFVAPILQKLILNREPEAVLDWVGRIAGPAAPYSFKRIIPCHLENDVRATPADFIKAFSFLEKPPLEQTAVDGDGDIGERYSQMAESKRATGVTLLGRIRTKASLLEGLGAALSASTEESSLQASASSAKEEDLALLQSASDLLTDLGVVAPPAPKVSPRWRQ